MTVYDDVLAKAAAWKRTQGGNGSRRPRTTLPPDRLPGGEPVAGGSAPAGVPVLVCASDVEAVNVSWLWPGRLPFGKLTVVEGDPGQGKSTIVFDLAARLSVGKPLPDGTATTDGAANVVICTLEDGYADTVRPRLEAAGADLTRIHFFDRVKLEGQDFSRTPVFPDDLRYLEAAITQTGARFVIVDPLFAYLNTKTNTWNDAQARQALAPLQDLAARLGVAIVVIRHWTKGEKRAMYRGGGSIGITGAARSVLLVAPDPDNPERRILSPVKANLSELAPSLAYRIEPTTVPAATGPVVATRILWLGTDPRRADDLALVGDHSEGSALDDAKVWLEDALEHGARNPLDLRKAGEQAGHAWATIRRAKDGLGVLVEKQGFGSEGRWTWRLPKSLNPAYTKSVSTLGGNEHLRPVPTTYKEGNEEENTKMLTDSDRAPLRFPPALPAMPGELRPDD